MAEANRVSLIYVPEVTYGTTPVNSVNWKTLRFTGEALLPDYSTKQSEEIRSDRNRSDVVQTSATAGGTVNFELSGATLDDFMEAVLGGTWTADVLKVGTAKRSFSIEKQFGDLASGNKYDVFSGMRIGEMKLDLAFDEIAKGTMTFAGNGVTDSATSAVGTGTLAAATTTQPYNSTLDVIAVEIDGVASSLYFETLSLTLAANLRPINALGALFARNQAYGSAGVTIDAKCFFDNRSLEDKVRSGAPFSISFSISDGSYDYEFTLPNAFATTRGGLNASALDTDVTQDITIAGAYDSGEATSVIITRTAP